MKLREAVALAFASTALVTTEVRAQGDRWERDVRTQLGGAAASLDPRAGNKPVTTRFGTLNAGESDSLTLPLHAGTAYVVVAACDEDLEELLDEAERRGLFATDPQAVRSEESRARRRPRE